MSASSVSEVTEQAPAEPSPWVTMGVILAGGYPFVLHMTMMGVALPAIGADLGAGSVLGVDWVVTAYLLGLTLMQPAAGWMADRWGKKRVYIGAQVLFTLGSLLAGLAPNLHLLVGSRLLQGMGGGAMMPIGMAMVHELFPAHRRGVAMGVWGVAIMGGPAVGPPLGGLLVTTVSWRWMFLATVPVSLATLVLAPRLLRDLGFRNIRPLDWQGWLLVGGGIIALLVGARQLPEWGPGSPATVGLMAAGLIALGVFVLRARRHPTPLLDLSVFASPTFRTCLAVSALLTVSHYARLNFLPVELQVVRDLSASEVGLLLSPEALGIAVMMPLGGWLTDRVGARLPSTVGLVIVAVGMWLLANLDPGTSVPALVAILVLSGLGTGLVLTPNITAAMNALPTRYLAQNAVLRSLNRQVAAALSVAVLAAVLVAQVGAVAPAVAGSDGVAATQQAYNSLFLIGFVATLAALVVALWLPGRAGILALQHARSAELDRS